jgi:hypothetical protein
LAAVVVMHRAERQASVAKAEYGGWLLLLYV